MGAVIHRFPTPAAFVAQREAEARRVAMVAVARAVLRSAADHSDEILIEACTALMTWGDGTDWLEADAMLMAIRIRARRRAHEAAEVVAKRGTIRRELRDAVIFVAFGAAVLIVGLAL